MIATTSEWDFVPAMREVDQHKSAYHEHVLESSAQGVTVFKAVHVNTWQIEGAKKILAFTNLSNNWDSYGSPPPTQDAATTAMELLTEVDIDYLVAPRVVPVSGGGLQLEWEVGTRGLELEILSDGSVEYLKTEQGEPCEEGCIDTIAEERSLLLWLLRTDSSQLAA